MTRTARPDGPRAASARGCSQLRGVGPAAIAILGRHWQDSADIKEPGCTSCSQPGVGQPFLSRTPEAATFIAVSPAGCWRIDTLIGRRDTGPLTPRPGEVPDM